MSTPSPLSYFLQHPQIHPLPTPPRWGTAQPYLIPRFQTSLARLIQTLFDLSYGNAPKLLPKVHVVLSGPREEGGHLQDK